MITVKRVFTRPNTGINFFGMTESLRQHIQDTYITPGHCLSMNIVNLNEFKAEVTMIWANQAAFDSYKDDPVVRQFINDRTAYNQINNVADELTITES